MIVSLALIAAGVGAGVFGSLLGLGGGILIVPVLTLGFGMGVRDAAGISLVAVIVTSSAAASLYLQRHTANLRLGMSLELFTAFGALVGGLIAFTLSDRVLAALFAILLAYTAFTMARRRDPRPVAAAATVPGGTTLVAGGSASAASPSVTTEAIATGTGATAESGVAVPLLVPDGSPSGPVSAAGSPTRRGFQMPYLSAPETLERLSGPGYHVHHLGRGIIGAVFAGIVSAILGVGGGIVKVPVMNLVMGVPLRVATATSNLMIGVTATASAVLYILRGGMDPLVAGPIAVGVFIGASIGSRIAPLVDLRLLRILFVVVMVYTAIQMILRAVGS